MGNFIDSKGEFTGKSLVTKKGAKVLDSALQERKEIEGELAVIRLKKKPVLAAEKECKGRLAAIDAHILEALDDGAVHPLLRIESKEPRQAFSEKILRKACADLGWDFDVLVEAADFGPDKVVLKILG